MPWCFRLLGLASLLANGALLSMRPDGPRAPIAAAAVAESGRRASAERSDDGLFHLIGRRDGRAVTFVVDTGASVTVLTADDAARLGAQPLPNAGGTTLATAGGQAAMRWARLPSLEVGGRHLPGLDVAVVRDGIGRSLLGQDVLAQIGVIVMDDDRLEIRPHGQG